MASVASDGGAMAEIVLEDVTKVYGDGTPAVTDLTLDVHDGEFIVLVGPSGCGKTTALRMVAGLESISGGTIRIGDRVVNAVPPKDRDIAMVFQNYALYPHMTVYDNMAFGLKLRKLSKTEIDRRVREAAEILGLEEFLQRKPKALSGGQRQRVAMGRAIVREPEGVPDGRAAVEPGREAPRPDADRDRADPARPADDDDLRHPRPGRGDDDGRPRGRDPQGRPPAGRHAAGPLRPPAQRLRRRVHRLAGDEHGRGDPRPRRRRRVRRVRRPAAPAARGGHLVAPGPARVRGQAADRRAPSRGHGGRRARRDLPTRPCAPRSP